MGSSATALALAAAALVSCTGRVGDPQDAPRSSTPQPPATPDEQLESGTDFWRDRCVSCHGNFASSSAISSGNANGDFRLDANTAIEKHGAALEQYIDDNMPFGNPDACRGRCAELTGAYIRSRAQPVVEASCDPNDTITYGARELKLLTSSEYQHALEDILGVGSSYGTLVANNDGARGGFPNMIGKAVNGSTLDNYVRNAEAIAALAAANNKPFSCTGAACAQRFVDEFLFKTFRGPVSDEQRALFTGLFETYPADGMRLALEAALASPYFLYRVEAGVELQTAIDRGFYTHSENAENGGSPSSAMSEVILAGAFPGGSGALEGDVWAFTENGAVELSFTTAFTDPTIIEVEARGSNYDALWPELTVRAGGTLIGVERVDRPELATYRFVVQGQSGSPRVRIEFNNDAGAPPYSAGQDVNLYIARVGITTTASSPPPPPSPPMAGEMSALMGVDPQAFVLTPYELASALSFMLTGSTPDTELLETARADQLTTRAQIEAQVVRLIDSERGRQHFGDFVADWFSLNAVNNAERPEIAEFTPEVKQAMVQEVREHFNYIFYGDHVPFREFFGGNYTFLNRTLAQFYGVPGEFQDAFVKTEVAGRGGPIASGAFMAANAHVERTAPILRAVHARQTALCHSIDPPNSPIAGPDIDAQRAAAQMRVAEREERDGVLSSRDFYFLYTDGIEACAACHQRIINPMFGMEDFDNVGRLRPSAGDGKVIETIRGVETEVSLAGRLLGVESVVDTAAIDYAGAKDFSNKIAATDAVKACLVRKGFRYVTGLAAQDRDLEIADQEVLSEEQRHDFGCVASRMSDVLANSDSPRAMFIALATESLMRLRR